ncbi:MAG: YggS family pyridoxal phosphate-dependent enzyme [Clostridia bacterium]|jgi:pyridoxal phosphate enzyme (YggS family)|nr:YggS family pyridoxal phosphate-dependent enzyme [Clostridia bacterium]
MGVVAANIAALRQRIAIAAEQAGRKPEEIELIAVTKTVDVPRIREAMAEGITSLGENRVQELTAKYEEVGPEANWHLIGHLQTNKVKYIVDKVALIHSLDRMSLARELSKRAQAISRVVPVLVQVNIAEEESKFGLYRDEVIPFIEEVRSMPGLKIQGLMTIAPLTGDPEEVRPVFRSLKELAVEIGNMGFPEVEMRYLSMGMTNDFEVAIQEGANMIRVGSGIFGERS